MVWSKTIFLILLEAIIVVVVVNIVVDVVLDVDAVIVVNVVFLGLLVVSDPIILSWGHKCSSEGPEGYH